MKVYFWLIFVLILLSPSLKGQCDSIALGNDTTICEGEGLQLDAGAGFYSYLWNDGSTDQFLTVNDPGIYWCEVVEVDSTNQVFNGDFSSGDMGFSTEYIWGTGGPWGILSDEGTYVIDSDASNTHVNFAPCVDHTTGDGLFMIVNGNVVQGENVWCQTVDVEPSTDYYFSGWFTSVHPSNPAILSYFINGEVIETVYLDWNTCNWENFIKEWNSGSNTTAEICIINQNTEEGGNDFGIDDIHLLKFCPSVDTIEVFVEELPVVDLGNDTVLCEGGEIELSAGNGYTSYLWNDGSEDSTILVTGSGSYWVEVTNDAGCVGTDTILIDFSLIVDFSLGNDTIICQGSSMVLDAGDDWASHLWFNGSLNQTITVSSPGSYWVVVEDANGCTGIDTVLVDLSPAVQASLGGDTTLCTGEYYILSPGTGFSSYMWQDGSTGSSFPVSNTGMYWVMVTDIYGCTGSDTVEVVINPSPEVSLGNDTVICSGTTLLLDPGSQYSSYLWQDNSTFPTYSVYIAGLYTVTITNIYDCPASSEVFVEVTSPNISLGPDTILCDDDSLYLDPGQGYDQYLWQDGQTSPVYLATMAGTYTVEVTDVHSCTSQESVILTEVAVPEAGLGGDQVLCEGDTLHLETQAGPWEFRWNGVLGTNRKEVTTGGSYQVEVSNVCGMASDQAEITGMAVPVVDLGEDRVLQEGESIELDAGTGYDQYMWQDGSTGQYYLVSSTMVDPNSTAYWVEVWNGPCKNSDTTNIELFRVKVPNVITPNGDGVNDLFLPMDDGWSGITHHHMEVFNRWGEQVWETDHFEEGWDGKRNGTYVTEGTYFWVLEVFYSDNSSVRSKGTVVVLGTN